MFVANPFTVRGHRLSVALNATHIFYGCKENLVAHGRADGWKTSAVYTGN